MALVSEIRLVAEYFMKGFTHLDWPDLLSYPRAYPSSYRRIVECEPWLDCFLLAPCYGYIEIAFRPKVDIHNIENGCVFYYKIKLL